MYDKQLLYSLVMDCETFRLSEMEAKEYIKNKTNGECEISSRHYHRVKKRIRSEPESQNWLNYQARIGFVIEHKKRIDEMDLVQKVLIRLLSDETSKDESNQNKELILKISSQIGSANKRLSELNLGSPVIAGIKNQRKEKEDAKGISGDTEGVRGADQNRIF